MKTKYWEID